jgi:hypothetical protein
MSTWRDFGSLGNGRCSFGRCVDGAACNKPAGHDRDHASDFPLPKATRGQLVKALRAALCPMDCDRWATGPGGSDYDTEKPCTCGRVALVGDST